MTLRKTREGASHPDRDDQFRHINRKAREFQAKGEPVISVDTKKEELVGDFHVKGKDHARVLARPPKLRTRHLPPRLRSRSNHAIPARFTATYAASADTYTFEFDHFEPID